jgi:excisionase family DNA binding protein
MTDQQQHASDLLSLNFLFVEEVAALLRVSKMTVYRMVTSGELASVQFNGRTIRIPEWSVRELLAPALTNPTT